VVVVVVAASAAIVKDLSFVVQLLDDLIILHFHMT
jgi:hypothetical protein